MDYPGTQIQDFQPYNKGTPNQIRITITLLCRQVSGFLTAVVTFFSQCVYKCPKSLLITDRYIYIILYRIIFVFYIGKVYLNYKFGLDYQDSENIPPSRKLYSLSVGIMGAKLSPLLLLKGGNQALEGLSMEPQLSREA